jgi:hypothetical protein
MSVMNILIDSLLTRGLVIAVCGWIGLRAIDMVINSDPKTFGLLVGIFMGLSTFLVLTTPAVTNTWPMTGGWTFRFVLITVVMLCSGIGAFVLGVYTPILHKVGDRTLVTEHTTSNTIIYTDSENQKPQIEVVVPAHYMEAWLEVVNHSPFNVTATAMATIVDGNPKEQVFGVPFGLRWLGADALQQAVEIQEGHARRVSVVAYGRPETKALPFPLRAFSLYTCLSFISFPTYTNNDWGYLTLGCKKSFGNPKPDDSVWYRVRVDVVASTSDTPGRSTKIQREYIVRHGIDESDIGFVEVQDAEG